MYVLSVLSHTGYCSVHGSVYSCRKIILPFILHTHTSQFACSTHTEMPQPTLTPTLCTAWPNTSDTSVFCLKWDITMCMCAHAHAFGCVNHAHAHAHAHVSIYVRCVRFWRCKGRASISVPRRPSARPSDRRLSRLCQHRVRRIGVALGVAVLYL